MARAKLLLAIRQGPLYYRLGQSRWRLATLLQVCLGWLRVSTRQGLWRVMRRLGVGYKRARLHVHSPDPDYQPKLAHICTTLSGHSPPGQVVLFHDECTVYSKPSQGWDYEARRVEPRAELGLRAEQSFRVSAALDALSGRVTYLIRKQFTVSAMVAFYQHLCQQYPGRTLLLVQDNWPMHYHPSVRAALQSQRQPFALPLPKSWQLLGPEKKYQGLELAIQALPLPTYASWLNPVEKLWRWLKQDLVHCHPFTDDLAQLKLQVGTWLDQFGQGSDQLLSYVGLAGKENIYSPAIGQALAGDPAKPPLLWDG